jgi:hypothetical protein
MCGTADKVLWCIPAVIKYQDYQWLLNGEHSNDDMTAAAKERLLTAQFSPMTRQSNLRLHLPNPLALQGKQV